MRRMIMWQACICVMLMFMSMNSGPTNEEAINSAQIQEILKEHRGGVVRGVHFRMQKESVSALEETQCLKTESDRLVYAIKESDSGTNEVINVYYNFSSDGLQDITMESVLIDKSSAIKLFRNLAEHYDLAYGQAIGDKDNDLTWTTTDRSTGMPYHVTCDLEDISVTITYSAI